MGQRAWLTELLSSEILPAIARLKDSKSGRATCQKLAQSLRQTWCDRGFVAPNQQQSLMAATRRAIKDRFGENHFSLEAIDFSRDEYFELNRLRQEKARERQLRQQYLQDPDAIVDKALQLLSSVEWAEVAAGLAVLTGRRLNEVLHTAQFTVKSRWVVTFTGALKRRGESVPLVFDIPTLAPAERVVSAAERLRQMTPPDANETLVGAASDRSLADLIPLPHGKDKLYTHLWRSVFACIATFWYCPKHVDELLFKAHIMGHFESLTHDEKSDELLLQKRLETFSSSRHYRRYEIDDAAIASSQGQRKGVKLGIDGVEPMDVFVDGMPDRQPPPLERRQLSTLRTWKPDRDRLVSLLQRFEGSTQADRVKSWIDWTVGHLPDEPDGVGDHLGESEVDRDRPGEHEVVSEVAEVDDSTSDEILVEPVGSVVPESSGAGGLESKLDKLLDVMTLFVQLQLQQDREQPAATVAPKARTQPTSTSQTTPTTPVQAVEQSHKPRQYKTGEADALVHRAIDAIMAHNNQPDLIHDLKWAITINGLKSFHPNQRAIQRILESRRSEIEAHHQLHQLQPSHNHRHKRKRQISDAISLD